MKGIFRFMEVIFFVMLAIISITYDIIILKVVAKIWIHGYIATTKSSMARNASSEPISEIYILYLFLSANWVMMYRLPCELMTYSR